MVYISVYIMYILLILKEEEHAASSMGVGLSTCIQIIKTIVDSVQFIKVQKKL